MRPGARWTIGGAILVAMIVGIAIREDELTYSQTSFGTRDPGQRAAFDLLDELGIPVSRSYARAADLPERATVWWLEPHGLCAEIQGERLASGRSDVWHIERWIAEGSTAVVWLPDRALDCLGEATFAEVAIPRREGDLPPEPVDETDEGEEEERIEDADEAEEKVCSDQTVQILSGPLTAFPRALEGDPLWRFLGEEVSGAAEWDVRAYLDGEPFVIQRKIGAGRLVLVADGRPASNSWLGTRDASLLVTDMAYAFGAPAFDERQHGLVASRNAFAYLATSVALPALLGVVGVAALLAWSGAAMPRPRLQETEGEAPTLDVFVDSLATLYARSNDRARLLDRYREFTMNQMRRTLQLPPDTSGKSLLERLQTVHGVSQERLRHLFEAGDPPRGPADFFERAAELDALVREVAP